MKRKAEITKRFRKVSWGRLYWKKSNPRMRRFNSDDVCIVLSRGVAIHYKSMEAFVRDLEDQERYGFIPPF